MPRLMPPKMDAGAALCTFCSTLWHCFGVHGVPWRFWMTLFVGKKCWHEKCVPHFGAGHCEVLCLCWSWASAKDQEHECCWWHRGGLRILSQHQHQLFQHAENRFLDGYWKNILARDRGCRGVHTSHCLNIAVAVTKVECTFFDESWSWLRTHRSWQYSRPIRRYDHYCPVGCNPTSCACF